MDWKALACGIASQFSFAKIRIFLHLNKNILHVYIYLTCRSDCCLCAICEGKIQWICAVQKGEKKLPCCGLETCCLESRRGRFGGRKGAVWRVGGVGLRGREGSVWDAFRGVFRGLETKIAEKVVFESGRVANGAILCYSFVCYVRFWSGRVLGCFEGFLRRKMPFFHFFGTFLPQKTRFGHVKQG